MLCGYVYDSQWIEYFFWVDVVVGLVIVVWFLQQQFVSSECLQIMLGGLCVIYLLVYGGYYGNWGWSGKIDC